LFYIQTIKRDNRKTVRKWILHIVILTVIFAGCKKIENPVIPGDSNSGTLAVPEFNWQMNKDVSFVLKNAKGKLVEITSTDGELIYLTHFGTTNQVETSIRMARTTTTLAINGVTIQGIDDAVVYTLPDSFKSTENAKWALDFNRVDGDYVLSGNPYISDFPITFEAWIKSDGPANNNWHGIVNPGVTTDMTIISFGNDSENDWNISLVIDKGNNHSVKLIQQKGADLYEQSGNTSVTDDNWHHIAGVITETTLKLYIDGLPEFEINLQTSTISPSDLSIISIGSRHDASPNSFFNGVIDEVRLWNIERSQEGISNGMYESINPLSAGLAGYWNMEESEGNIIHNMTSRPNLDGNFLSYLAGGNGPNWQGDIDTDEDGIANIYDDYPYDPERAFNNYWPAEPWTLAFEDLWPSLGDYDLNDIVVDYQFNRVTNANNELVEAIGHFELKANGAALRHGFGFSLPDILLSTNDFSVTGYDLDANYITLDQNGTEYGQNEITIIVDDKLPFKGNTYPGMYFGSYNFEIKITVDNVGPYYTVNSLGLQHWNPFFIIGVGTTTFNRRREVHLSGYSPSSLAATWQSNEKPYFDTHNDGSNFPYGGPNGGLWYKSNSLAKIAGKSFGPFFPWGLDIPKSFDWTIEADGVEDPDNGLYKFTLLQAYDEFEPWVRSQGATNQDWYEHITNSNFIFQIP